MLALVFAALFVPPAAAKRIHKTAPTHITLSATRSADGTITAQAKLTSPDPHCLVKDRVKKLSDGYYHAIGAALLYGGPWSLGPFGGADGIGEPPDGGWLAPVSSGGRSPWLWKATWPGDAEVRVENQNPNSTQPFKYVSTVGASSAVGLGATIANGNNPKPVYKAKYNQGGNRIIVRCLPKRTAKTFPF